MLAALLAAVLAAPAIVKPVNAIKAGSRDFTILDNTFIGRDDPNHLWG